MTSNESAGDPDRFEAMVLGTYHMVIRETTRSTWMPTTSSLTTARQNSATWLTDSPTGAPT